MRQGLIRIRMEILGALLAAPLWGRASPALKGEWEKTLFKIYSTNRMGRRGHPLRHVT